MFGFGFANNQLKGARIKTECLPGLQALKFNRYCKILEGWKQYDWNVFTGGAPGR